MTDQKKIRMADIAAKLGVSTVTVSKALADKEGVSDELRSTIKQTAAEIGYRIKASKSTPGITGNIGVLIPSRFLDESASFYWTMYNNIIAELKRYNYYCIMEQLSADDEKNLILPRVIRDQKADALVVLGQPDKDFVLFLTKTSFPVVFLNFYLHVPGMDAVISDNFYGMYQITQHLIENGHRNIAFIGNKKASGAVTDRLMGFMKAMVESGLQTADSQIISDTDEKGKNIPLILPDLLPTAFACSSDETAYRLIEELAARGLQVPADISVTGYDNYTKTNCRYTELTTVETDMLSMVRTAVDILLKKIKCDPYNRGLTILGGKTIYRNSVKDINTAL